MNPERTEILSKILSQNKHLIYLNSGTVFSISKKKLLGTINKQGYLTTSLFWQGKNYKFKIHEIIAFAGGLGVTGNTINHIDGNKLNNRLSNLEAISITENIRHAFQIGLSIPPLAYGEYSSKAKLCKSQVEDIKKSYSDSSYRKLAKKYGVVHTTIRDIIKGRSWAHGNLTYQQTRGVMA